MTEAERIKRLRKRVGILTKLLNKSMDRVQSCPFCKAVRQGPPSKQQPHEQDCDYIVAIDHVAGNPL